MKKRIFDGQRCNVNMTNQKGTYQGLDISVLKKRLIKPLMWLHKCMRSRTEPIWIIQVYVVCHQYNREEQYVVQ